MAAKLSTELLFMILNNLQLSHSTRDLYSSLLVNRHWCKVTIPILWKSPFGQELHDEMKSRKEALCIRTFISCLDTQARTLLTQNGFDLSSSPPRATFDYPSFIHKFSISNFVYFISIHSQQIIDKHFYNDYSTTMTKSRILFKEICKLIINRCAFLDHFDVRGFFSIEFLNCDDDILKLPGAPKVFESILKLPDAPKVFKKLKSFTSKISILKENDLILPLYKFLASNCHNILNMDLSLNSNSDLELFSLLIRDQKRLENLTVDAYGFSDWNSIFWAIFNQKKTLKKLDLTSVHFNNNEGIPPIGQFDSLQELYISKCNGLHKLFRDLPFTKLSIFHYHHGFDDYSQLIIKIFESAKTNLKDICLVFPSTITFEIFSPILNYCTKVTELSLHKLSHEQVKTIFNNNFNELRRFSFECRRGFNANKLFCQMATNVPKSLETIEIIMDYNNPWKFSADNLRKFLKRWCEGGGGNKKIIVKNVRRIVKARPFKFNADHIKVIKEYGIQFDIK